MAVSVARALILGHVDVKFEEGDGASSIDERAGSGYTEILRDHAALQDFLKARGCIIESGTVCDTELSSSLCASRIEAFLGTQYDGLRLLVFLGNASNNGDWCFRDGDLQLSTINDIWNRHDRSSKDNLFIYSDSCFSGKVCERALEIGASFVVQASCGGDASDDGEALDNVFTSMWLRVHRSPEHLVSILKDFQDQNQQTPAYYVPQLEYSLCCGELHLQLLGSRIALSGGNQSDPETMSPPFPELVAKPRWHELHDQLPYGLQLQVAELALRFGDDPNFENMIELMVVMERSKARRRGGDGDMDVIHIAELLAEFVADKSLSAEQAYEKFKDEFC